jgi:hypothetical protein
MRPIRPARRRWVRHTLAVVNPQEVAPVERSSTPDDQVTPPEGFQPVAGGEGFAPQPAPAAPRVQRVSFSDLAILMAIIALTLLAWQAGESHYQSCVTRAAINTTQGSGPEDPDGCTILPWSKPGD